MGERERGRERWERERGGEREGKRGGEREGERGGERGGKRVKKKEEEIRMEEERKEMMITWYNDSPHCTLRLLILINIQQVLMEDTPVSVPTSPSFAIVRL